MTFLDWMVLVACPVICLAAAVDIRDRLRGGIPTTLATSLMFRGWVALNLMAGAVSPKEQWWPFAWAIVGLGLAVLAWRLSRQPSRTMEVEQP